MSTNRFAIAQDGPKPSDAQLANQAWVREAIESAAARIEGASAPSREQSLALTKLEEALMWSGKAIFS